MEVVPAQVATEISKRTKMLIIGMGAGVNCDVQYLFATDILGDNEGHVPRHSKVYRDFKSEYHRLHRESVAAFKEFRSDVLTGSYPSAQNDVSIDKGELTAFLKAIKSKN
jgi:3-methyl-2-oxobutanoate hydroxymethyltransferase